MYTLELPYRQPFDWESLLAFLAARAIRGVEAVADGAYWRTVRAGDRVGELEVRRAASRDVIEARISLPRSTRADAESRLRGLFDLDCDPATVRETLEQSPVTRDLVRRRPGLRVPGCWDPFEVVVRAIVGQQVSLAGARTILGRIVDRVCDGNGRVFPSPEQLGAMDLRGLGMPDGRAENLRGCARAVSAGDVDLSAGSTIRPQLLRLRGIGPWTAEYVAMRAFGDADAFPVGDLVLRRAAGQGRDLRPRELSALAETWRPRRAYAAVHLWSDSAHSGR